MNDNSKSTVFASGASLQLDDVCKNYGDVSAVSNVSFEIQAGEFVTLLGPSGSGKSTVLKMIAGFENPSSGHIKIAGAAVENLEPGKRNLGMVFQNYALFPHLTVVENVAYGLKFRKMSKRQREDKVDQMLNLVQMDAYRNRYPKELSGGQQQRIALARSLAIEPRLLLMDEPLGALDRSLRIEMSSQIKKLHRETGTTFLYVTHDQEEALILSDRVAIMKNASLISCDDAETLYNSPPDPFTAEFFGNCNRVHISSIERGANLFPGSQHLYFHQEDVQVSIDASDMTQEVQGRGVVSEVLFMGTAYQLIIQLNEEEKISSRIPRRDTSRLPGVGEQVFFGTRLGDTHGFIE